MAIATFDTLRFAKKLKACVVPDKQAEGETEAFAEIIQLNLLEIATKDHLKHSINGLARDIANLEKDMRVGFAALAKEMASNHQMILKAVEKMGQDLMVDFKRKIQNLGRA